ncbi:MAG: hypothetical protein ACP5I8_03940 [Phycisphaerae bacterium]
MKQNFYRHFVPITRTLRRTMPWGRGMAHYARQPVELALLAVGLLFLAACGVTLHHYPEPNVGWHSKNYSVVFGVLSRHNTNPISWTIRYSSVYSGDPYGGKFALTPVSVLVGYSPGNTVEIHGHPEAKAPNKAGTGTLYAVKSIRLWLGKGRPNNLTR